MSQLEASSRSWEIAPPRVTSFCHDSKQINVSDYEFRDVSFAESRGFNWLRSSSARFHTSNPDVKWPT